jgi:hypothetical protein
MPRQGPSQEDKEFIERSFDTLSIRFTLFFVKALSAGNYVEATGRVPVRPSTSSPPIVARTWPFLLIGFAALERTDANVC